MTFLTKQDLLGAVAKLDRVAAHALRRRAEGAKLRRMSQMEVDELKKDESELKHHRRQSLLKHKGGAAPAAVSDSDIAAAGLAGGRAPMDGLAEAEEEEAEVNGGEDEQEGEEDDEGEDWDDDEEFDGELRVTEEQAEALMQASDANAKDELAKLSTTAAAWTMLQDPSLGTLYYYNKITEQVTSEMPESWVERNRLIAEALAIVPDEASVGGDDGGAGTVTAEGGVEGRRELEAAENMMPPEVDMGHVLDGVEGGEEAEDGELETDWEEFSDDDGRAYYFNTETDETTYDRPVKEEAGSDDVDDDEIYTRTSVLDGTGEEEGGGDEKEVATMMKAVEEEEEDDEDKENEEEAVIEGAAEDGEDGDESGGEDNGEGGDAGEVMGGDTGGDEGGDEIQEEGRDENAAAGGCDDATAEEEVKECVPGRERRWSTYQDDDGDNYYHNEITNETTYDVPEEFAEANGEEGGDATGDVVGSAADEDWRRRLGARSMNDEDGDKDDSGNDGGGSGDTTNGSNGVSSGEGGGGGVAGPPPASTEEEDTNERISPPSFSTRAESEAWFKKMEDENPDGLASDDHGILLPGWKSFDTEDGTNKLYYHNDATGETVWKRPGVILPFQWESRQDDDGQVYYVHDESEESVWELPVPQYVCECRGAGGAGGREGEMLSVCVCTERRPHPCACDHTHRLLSLRIPHLLVLHLTSFP